MANSANPDQLASEEANFQKPTDLDLHCLLRRGMTCLAREGLMSLQTSFKSFLDDEGVT